MNWPNLKATLAIAGLKFKLIKIFELARTKNKIMALTPIGHEKKYTWKRVKYRKKTRGKKCIPWADRILLQRDRQPYDGSTQED